MTLNFNSVIIYFGLVGFFLLGLLNGRWGGFFGILTGMFIIFFVLANDRERENIIGNLTFRKRIGCGSLKENKEGDVR